MFKPKHYSVTLKALITTAADEFLLLFRENKNWRFILIVCLELVTWNMKFLFSPKINKKQKKKKKKRTESSLIFGRNWKSIKAAGFAPETA